MPITKKDVFVPTKIGGCGIWLDSADTSASSMTFSSGQNISVWKDKSGNANDFSLLQGVATVTNDGRTVVNFAADFPILKSANQITFTGSSAFFLVCKLLTDTRLAYAVAFPDIKSGDFSIRFAFGSLVGTAGYAGDTSDLSTSYYLNGNFNPTSVNCYNTFSIIDTVLPNTGSGSTSYVTLSSSKFGRFFSGYIAEFIYFPAGVSTAQRNDIEGYLAQKWSLTGSLPANHIGLTETYYYLKGARRPALTKVPYFSVFTPLSFSGCTLWLDASQDTTANGVSIASLVDRSGSGNSLTPSGTISAATNFLRGKTVYNFGSSRASKTNFPWQTSFTQIVLVKCATGNWLSSLVSGGSYLAYIFAGNDNLINVNNFFNPRDSSNEVGTSVFTYATDGVTSWIILSLGYQSNATSASNYTINGTVKTSATSTAVSSAISATNQLWLNGNASSTFDTGVYVAEMMHYNSVLTNSQRQQVESYLAQKWGLLRYLPTDHGFYTNPGGGPQLGIVNTTITISGNQFYVTDGLVYHLDAGNKRSYSGSGSTWTDLTGSGIAATLVGSPTYSSANGGSLLFDGSTQYATTASSIASISGTGTSWTIEAFIYYNATSSGGGPCIFTNYYTTGNLNIPQMLGAISPGANVAGVSNPAELQVGYYVRNSGLSSFYVTPEQTPLTSGNWYHIVGTFDRTNLKLYINNVLNNTTASTAGTLLANTAGYRIMTTWNTTNNPAGFWGGNLAILRLYSRALTADEVTTNYNSTRRPPSRFGLS